MKRAFSASIAVAFAAAMTTMLFGTAAAQSVIFDIRTDAGPGGSAPLLPGDTPFFPPGQDSHLIWQFRNYPDGTIIVNHGLIVNGTSIPESSPPVALPDGTIVDVRRSGEFGGEGIFSVPPGAPPSFFDVTIFVTTNDPAQDRTTEGMPIIITTEDPGVVPAPTETPMAPTPVTDDPVAPPFSTGFPDGTPTPGLAPPPADPGSQGIGLCKDTDPVGDPTVFDFVSTLGPTSLSDGQCAFPGNIPAGLYHIAELVPAGWTLDNIVCQAGVWFGNGASTTTVTAPAVSIDLAEDDGVVCVYTDVADPTSEGDARGLSVLGSGITPTSGLGASPVPAQTGQGFAHAGSMMLAALFGTLAVVLLATARRATAAAEVRR